MSMILFTLMKIYKIIAGILSISTCKNMYICVFKEIQNSDKDIQLSVLVSDFI